MGWGYFSAGAGRVSPGTAESAVAVACLPLRNQLM